MVKASWQPYLMLGVGLLAVSAASILIRQSQAEHASSFLISAWRVGTATLVLTPAVFGMYRADLRKLRRSDLLLVLLSGLMLTVHFASWISSLEYTSVISSTVLVNTHPLVVALVSPFLLRERLSRTTLIAIVIAVAGIIIVSLAGDAGTAVRQNNAMLGNVLALVGAVTVAAYYVIGRRVRARVAVIPYIWLTYGTSAILLFILTLATGQQIVGLSANAYLWMTLTGLIPQLIGHSAYNYALGYLSAAYVSLTILGEPVVSTILAIILLGEFPKIGQLPGGVLILLALVIASREETANTRRVVQEDEIENAAAL